MTKRTPKLDPEWMKALGFDLVDNPQDYRLRWRNRSLQLFVDDTSSHDHIVDMYTRAVKEEATKRTQWALREALLPAMGLQVAEEHSEGGYVTRTYVTTE